MYLQGESSHSSSLESLPSRLNLMHQQLGADKATRCRIRHSQCFGHWTHVRTLENAWGNCLCRSGRCVLVLNGLNHGAPPRTRLFTPSLALDQWPCSLSKSLWPLASTQWLFLFVLLKYWWVLHFIVHILLWELCASRAMASSCAGSSSKPMYHSQSVAILIQAGSNAKTSDWLCRICLWSRTKHDSCYLKMHGQFCVLVAFFASGQYQLHTIMPRDVRMIELMAYKKHDCTYMYDSCLPYQCPVHTIVCCEWFWWQKEEKTLRSWRK